jgi:quercetin dioxygenase-like cupin family protein
MNNVLVHEGMILMGEHSYLRTHDLAAEHLVIDLGDAATELHGLAPDDQSRSGVTLVKQGGLNVVLTHIRASGTLAEHSAPGAATVQVLSGHVRVQVGEESLDVPAGQLIAFDARVRHGVEAVEDSTLLLTLTDPLS